MNRRSFFRGLVAAAATVVARAYVPSSLVVADTPAPEIITLDVPIDEQHSMRCVMSFSTGDGVTTIDGPSDGPWGWHVSQCEVP